MRIMKRYVNNKKKLNDTIFQICLLYDGLSDKVSERPNITQFQTKFENLKLELNTLIKEDEQKFKNYHK